ncbi:ribbon-helix-helix domain-containing protein [Georgenia sp. TF02-10]|uniref:ribbon-helix-helix domain-containing protein n=1 Tax=Georgenia sp. TF02-10 TaxID=2917725 RepID=UPI001FA736D2|nr:ribbon-helix-helix domain-containing protein [Georgenia sp. TF02-10]UNX55444.1 ribbon-helix-helix domain-containing protein [Georgenia sp. TF02-10]
MKLSVSLSADEVASLDKYARATGLRSRSAVVQHAIRLLGDPDLEQDYAAAWDEWESSGESSAWDATAGDGLVDAPR